MENVKNKIKKCFSTIIILTLFFAISFIATFCVVSCDIYWDNSPIHYPHGVYEPIYQPIKQPIHPRLQPIPRVTPMRPGRSEHFQQQNGHRGR